MKYKAQILCWLTAGVVLAAGCHTNENAAAPSARSGTVTSVAKPAQRTENQNRAAVAVAASNGANSTSADEMLQPTAGMIGFGAENNRIVDEPGEIISVLKNGATVIVKRIDSPVVAVRGCVFAGGIYEGKWLGGGLSHLLEHLVAGGSNQRRSEAENRDLLQKIGNNSNAYTTEDQTAFFINTTSEHMEEAVDLVTGWMLTALITPEEYRREYQVVQRELEMGKGDPDRQLYYLAAENRYHFSPARVPVIGYQPVIQGLSRDDVYSYYKMAYQPNNMVFCVAGDMEPRRMLAAVQKNLAAAKPGRAFSHDIELEPRVVSPRTQVATFPKLGQAKLLLGFPSVRLDHPDLYALDLLAEVLGGGESSLMTEQLRDKQQLVSAVAVSDDTPAYDAGTFGIVMDLEPEKIPQATEAVMAIIDSVKNDGVDEAALQRAKAEIRAARVKRLQTAEEIAGSLIDDYMTTGDAHFSDRYVERIEHLTSDDLRRAARKQLNRTQLLTTALLPAEFAGAAGLPRVEELIRPTAAAATTRNTLQPASPVERVQLDNGTVLLLKRISTSPLVVMQQYSLGGLTDENAQLSGIGNLTMRMLMRGTKTRDAQQIARFFSSTGGEMSTGSGNNSWFWTATCLRKNFEKTIEVYADVMNDPAFDDKELARMKRRIVAEIHSEDANWSAEAFRFFKQEYFGPLGSPYQFVVVGTEPNVESFTAKQLRDWYEMHVLPRRRVLAIYGDIDIDQAKSLAANLLGKPNNSESHGATNAVQGNEVHEAPSVQNETSSATPSIDVRRVAVQKTDQELSGVVVGFDSRNVIGEPEQYDMILAQTIAGGYTYPTGYLFETLRGRGLVYEVFAENFPGRNASLAGTFFVYAGCAPAKVNEVVDAILQNIAREQGSAQDINPQWFTRAKDLIVLADAMDHETPSQQAATAALDELYGLGYNYHERFADKIRGVGLADVQAVARRRLRVCVVTVSTPRPDLVHVTAGVRRYMSFPTVDLTPRGIQHDTGGGAGK